MNKQNTFNDFRFEGLDCKEASNKYLTMKRVNAEGTKCVVEVAKAQDELKNSDGWQINPVRWCK